MSNGANNQSVGFSSGWIFVLAAAGSAVGLGNIWKFPYITGVNGGGAFVLFYLLCIVLIGLPVMLAEIYIGWRGKKGPVDSYHSVAEKVEGAKGASSFAWMGYIYIVTAIAILSFYGVVGGWSIYYTWEALTGSFSGITPDGAGGLFGGLLGNTGKLIFYQILFMILVVYVVARGVNAGIEKAVVFLMPIFFVMLICLTIYALLAADGGRAMSFMFSTDFSKLTSHAMVEALGHAFFSLSLGMGAMLVYGSYIPKNVNITKMAIIICVVDTAVALLAGLMIFSFVFANGGEASGGPGLLFIAIPVAFGNMTGGYIIGVAWFALIIVAAWTSGISMLENIVAHFEERGWERKKAAIGFGIGITLIGFGTVGSLAGWFDTRFIGDKNFFDSLDFITSSVFLPVGGLVVCLVAGWLIADKFYKEYLPELGKGVFFISIRFITKFIAPVLIIILLGYLIITGLGLQELFV